jgi:hypothetical protein
MGTSVSVDVLIAVTIELPVVMTVMKIMLVMSVTSVCVPTGARRE